ncbi:MAG: phage major capsid protein [Hyphomicrobium sp.]
MTDYTHLETKAGHTDLSQDIEDLMRAFEAFKDTNDDRLAQIERRSTADAVTTDKLARIDRALDDTKRSIDELAVKAQRPFLGPMLGGAEPVTRAGLQRKAAFDGYMRRGEEAALRNLEAKALSVGSNPDGGYLVPPETETMVNRGLRAISPIRAIAGVRQVSGNVYKRPFSITGPDYGWVGETAARAQTNSPVLAELQFPTMEIYAMPAASSTLLDDSAVNIDEWLAEEVRLVFAEQEGKAFVTGDGINKPKGFLAYTTVANASWTWGNLGYIATGVAGAFPASNPADKIVDLIYSAKSPYRANANFVMNRSTQSVIRKMKDGQGNYLWQPSAAPGESPTLMGFGVAESEDMPDMAANSLSLAFGDFSRGYLIVDRVGIRVLRDPYSTKPYVLFYTTKRVGGGVNDFDAIKLMKFALG